MKKKRLDGTAINASQQQLQFTIARLKNEGIERRND